MALSARRVLEAADCGRIHGERFGTILASVPCPVISGVRCFVSSWCATRATGARVTGGASVQVVHITTLRGAAVGVHLKAPNSVWHISRMVSIDLWQGLWYAPR